MHLKLVICVTVLVMVSQVYAWGISEKTEDINLQTSNKLEDVRHSIYLSVYVFNLTNPDAVEAGEKPLFVELGPYVYREIRIRDNVTNSPNTVKYTEKKTYFFDAQRSKGHENDIVNTVNIPFVYVVHITKSAFVANSWLAGETLIRRNVKVGELLFDGFDISKYTDSPIGAALPADFDGGKFGLYKGKNSTNSKPYSVYTGVEDHENFGIMDTYDGKKELNYWKPNSSCDLVTGSEDGLLHSSSVKKDNNISVFYEDLCRSLTFTYAENSDLKGIKTYRFTIPKATLEDPRINPDNECYCVMDSFEDCHKAGTKELIK